MMSTSIYIISKTGMSVKPYVRMHSKEFATKEFCGYPVSNLFRTIGNISIVHTLYYVLDH